MKVIPLRSELDFLHEYAQTIAAKNPATVDAHLRATRQFITWLQERPGASGCFLPEQFTRTAVETSLCRLETEGYSISHRAGLKAALAGFARWLIAEKDVLRRNPTRDVKTGAQESLAPAANVGSAVRPALAAERNGEPPSEALFALGYWAGCRLSDVAWLTMEDAHVGPKIAWLRAGHKGGKAREIDLLNGARRPLHEYINHGGRNPESPFVFTSQRSDCLTEAGIHHWFRTLRSMG